MQLPAKYTPAFSRDLKKKATKHQWNLQELEAVIDLIIENTRESLDILKHRHNMHKLLGEWDGSNEYHVANAGDWLVIWKTVDGIAYFQHTGSHDELFGK
ncbi:type II toxin-antitoxin system YafQ family toxin [Mobiluncus mulieris]|uniref:type II toxin-antitoxin system YafQ family toxin n=1 Tax=Mobiluncus mulieris TaxID=2052 RepID=UPI00019F94B2|nr:type II toxin-antitoxin system YafQ family toxin [Mobiluncus mulieris]EEJ54578.1 addiction module toxin, RelE/StbE family [Mobiluncus mulieris ATCC 35243]MCV0002221.1 type II toxin-antitoxin system YafQ family toxin [Mobiluncus mulieris]SPX76541.1 mRNA interferase YafQ [Mobiluncus mulieris]